jgi:hypothetical protein
MQKMLDQMMTVAERNDPDNKQKAVNVLKWAESEGQKKEGGMPDFIRGDFFTPGSSGESTGTMTPRSRQSPTTKCILTLKLLNHKSP